MIPIKRYKKCFTTKEGKVIEYIEIKDFEDIIKTFKLELNRYLNKKLNINKKP